MIDIYPIRQFNPKKTSITIAQISDLHLSGVIGVDNSYDKFLKVLDLALSDKPDLLLLTGDLCNDGNPHAYDWLFKQLIKTNINFLCLAGNHDVTHEINSHLPYHQRTHLPIPADSRLLDQHQLLIKLDDQDWQLLLLDSTVPGQAFGRLSSDQLKWLDDTLSDHQKPSLVALHHHPLAMKSAWIDAYILKNHQQFLTIINKHQHIKAILCGHIHQACHLPVPVDHACWLLGCPSTSRQFLPRQADFALDELPAGYRLIQLDNKKQIASYIKRL